MKAHRDLKEKFLKEKDIERLCKGMSPEFRIIALLTQRRLKLGYSQEALAKKNRHRAVSHLAV